MSATNTFENGLLSLLFENANCANVGDATGLRGSSTAGVFYISLHTATPGETGNQTTSEAGYTSYARVSVARSAAAWTVAGGVADNDSAITFPPQPVVRRPSRISASARMPLVLGTCSSTARCRHRLRSRAASRRTLRPALWM